MSSVEDQNALTVENVDSCRSWNQRNMKRRTRITTGGDTASDQFSYDLGDDENWVPDGHDWLKNIKTPITQEEMSKQTKVINEIKKITEGFKLTFSEIKDSEELQSGILS